MKPIERYRLLRLYYLATPVFFLFDVVFHAPVRAAFLPAPGQRWAYYAFCLGCGLLTWARPHWTRPVVFFESCVNLLLLCLSVLLPIWLLVDSVETSVELPSFGPMRLVNFVLTGTVLLLAFYRNQPGAGRVSRRGYR
ncbi:MAG: hypothetical protein PVH00_00415 [Gemmatimonadota bacterium]|jgi:hypothetical protein